MSRLGLALAVLAAGCSFDVNGTPVDTEGGTVLDAAQLDAAQQPNLTIVPDLPDLARACDPAGANNGCSADQKSLMTCRANGSGFDSTACPFQCGGSGPTAHCQQLKPSGAVLPTDSTAATAAPSVTDATTFDTDSGAISGGITRAAGEGVKSGIVFRVATQASGTVKVGVFGFMGLTVAAGVVFHVQGQSALAITSAGDVSFDGTLDLQGDCSSATGLAGGGAAGMNGAGGGMGGGGGGVNSTNRNSGGGGGGYGDSGGAGGVSGAATGGASGVVFGDLVTDPVLLIGGGGGGGGIGVGSGRGGTGGGAVAISANGTLRIGGAIQAGGCGGVAGGNDASGGGGGAGGAILLEAAQVVLANNSRLTANGGGGGGGGASSLASSGAKATNTNTAAAGGTAGNNGGAGGNGGATSITGGATAPSVPGNDPNGGGGGGGVGRIALKTLAGTATDQGATISPDTTSLTASGKRVTTIGKAAFQ